MLGLPKGIGYFVISGRGYRRANNEDMKLVTYYNALNRLKAKFKLKNKI